MYVHWPGAGKDIGVCWDVGHFVLSHVACFLPDLPMYVGIVLGAQIIQLVSCGGITSFEYFIALSGCPVELIVIDAFINETGWRWWGSCFYVGLL